MFYVLLILDLLLTVSNIISDESNILCLFYVGSFPYNITQNTLAPGQHNVQVYSRKAEAPLTDDDVIGGVQFYIERMYSYNFH